MADNKCGKSPNFEKFPKIAGFYCAWHPWLQDCVKVGFTTDLGRRLTDDCYVTCFTPEWAYLFTLETASGPDANRIEQAVLYAARHYRIMPRELVRLKADAIEQLAVAVASQLKIPVRVKTRPVYAAATTAIAEVAAIAVAKVATAVAEVAATAIAATAVAAIAEVEHLTIPSELALAEPAVQPVQPVQPAVQPALPPAAAEDILYDECEILEVEQSAQVDFAPQLLEVREYQNDAIRLCIDELTRSGKAILQMACRTGKTPVAFNIIQSYAGTILFLVPGLYLLRQTAQKLAGYKPAGYKPAGYKPASYKPASDKPASAFKNTNMLLVGSSLAEVPLPGGAQFMTTDLDHVREFLAQPSSNASNATSKIIISTYQSSAIVMEASARLGIKFSLTVFDEAHRVCGGADPRPFTCALRAPPTGDRLFMTATPAYDGEITMKNAAMFGGIAYRYHLRQGIDAQYVNDFRLEFVAVDSAVAGAGAMAAAVLAASSQVDKLLVFCQDIKHAEALAAAAAAATATATAAATAEPAAATAKIYLAHSRLGKHEVAEALAAFSGGGRAIIFTVRMLQEGVEIPPLVGAFFAAPRHSSRDIIQSLCRPLNRVEGKPQSVIFLPVMYDGQRAPDDPVNLKRFAHIVTFVDALLSEDPRFYEYLLDPKAAPYPARVLFAGGTGTGTGAGTGPKKYTEAVILSGVRRAARYGTSTAANPIERLLRAENVPWDRGFAEIKRIVEVCGRYPKTTDAWIVGEARVCLHRFYRRAADEYAEWAAGRPTKLEPYQIADLETLRDWRTYGVEGPYPWARCMATLEDWLAANGGVPPMVEINRGGYVGLDASPLERLSGALTIINQSVFGKKVNNVVRVGDRVPPAHAADLDRICARWGLRWRKEFRSDGTVNSARPTFIQEAFTRFKAHWQKYGSESPFVREFFSDYPDKHARQESLAVQASGAAPPRWRKATAAATATAAAAATART